MKGGNKYMGYIYKITNIINQKSYIGLTTRTVEEHWQEHLRAMQNYKEKRPLYSALYKYGISNFTVETIEEINNEQQVAMKNGKKMQNNIRKMEIILQLIQMQ